MRYHTIGPLVLGLLNVGVTIGSPAPQSVNNVTIPATTVPSATSRKEKRGNLGGLYLCKERGFSDGCTYFQVPMGQCYNLLPEWRDVISSFGPDEAPPMPGDAFAFSCTIFSGENCSGLRYTTGYPGTGDLQIYGLDNIGKSFLCRFNRDIDLFEETA